MQTMSTITRPRCGTQKTEEMELDACRYFYVCDSCTAPLRPLSGDCCVFCSYGDVPCPPMQSEAACCSPEPLTT
jgi:hypothetical protein